MTFSGSRLKKARKYKNLTIDTLIQEITSKYDIKLNNGMVSKWENNKVIPRVEAVSILAEYLQVPVEYLLGRNDLANILLDLRLAAKKTIDELSEESGVGREVIVLTEGAIYNPENEEQLNRIGNALGISDLRKYIREKGYEGPITADEIKEKQTEESKPYSNQVTNLLQFLEGSNPISYGERILTAKEINKIKKVIEAIID
ncbi:helix-turn-helix domain-containing protein [Niallia sp. MER TA 168]|uniref:helix-turn-helix domain-containing protein n=1 Tax=Niallia sp. MER TA 168 TaxID=2939568 RepID=UPI00203FAFAA|nr:helix-turn-helix domain-containing protein [Niallia sp. MER TA 168]MCM3363185.1 helix-turn-helix domain-containing protein [Niallia sp. MER TA 168]